MAMDQKQKPMENVVPSQSQSGTNRRVMWSLSDGEEEVYESVVNYRSLSPAHDSESSPITKSDHNLPSTSHPQAAGVSNVKLTQPLNQQNTSLEISNDSSIYLAMRYKPSHESLHELVSAKRARAVGCWHSLFDRIRNKKIDSKASPTLALRYKPSHDSLKKRRSTDLQDERSRLTNSPKPKLATADLKLETCFLPPYQTAVVREVAPKFANRMCIPEDSDSCCSGSLEWRVPLLKTSKSRKMPVTMGLSALPDSTSFFSPNEVKSSMMSKIKLRSKTTSNSTAGTKGNGRKTASAGNTNTAMPSLRQRQQELHRFRVLIEKRRLELLDLKIVRERADALRHEILFHKDLQLKHNQIKAYEDNNSSQA